MTSPLPKVIFHDADGCLNDPSGEEFSTGDLGTLTLKQGASLREFGHLIDDLGITLVLNTGRNYWDVRHIAEGLECDHLRYALLEHSAYAWDFEKNHEVDLHAMAIDLHNVELSQRYGKMKTIEKLILWYQSEGYHFLTERMGQEAPKALNKRSNLSIEVPKGWTPPELMEALREVVQAYFVDGMCDTLQYCHSNFFVDILGPIHKSDGAKLFLEHLNFSAFDALVVGDGMNDLDMFTQDWPHLICPANSYEILKRKCRGLGGVVSDEFYGLASRRYLEERVI
jgi:hydroxymethylpyrimidine pyrophosphatase-like HAD family hydrolase